MCCASKSIEQTAQQKEAMKQPSVSIVMSVHNGARYLTPAVISVLRQKLTDWEMIIVNDGSTDGTNCILQQMARDDARIRIVNLAEKGGLAAALNAGISSATAPLIARMDADDIMHPDRLSQQVRFLRKHPEIGIVGSDAYLIDENSQVAGYLSMPCSDWHIRWIEASTLSTGLIHPSVVFRRCILAEAQLAYDPAFRAAQDKNLWAQFLRTTRAANIPKPLLYYRRHTGSISGGKRDEQRAFAESVLRRETERRLQRPLSEEEWRLLTDGDRTLFGRQFRQMLCKAMAPEWSSLRDASRAAVAARNTVSLRLARRARILINAGIWRVRVLHKPGWLSAILDWRWENDK